MKQKEKRCAYFASAESGKPALGQDTAPDTMETSADSHASDVVPWCLLLPRGSISGVRSQSIVLMNKILWEAHKWLTS